MSQRGTEPQIKVSSTDDVETWKDFKLLSAKVYRLLFYFIFFVHDSTLALTL